MSKLSFRQIVADKMNGYNFGVNEVKEVIETEENAARTFSRRLAACKDEEERKALTLNTASETIKYAETLAAFEKAEKELKSLRLNLIKELPTLVEAVNEYGFRSGEMWLTKVNGLSKLGIVPNVIFDTDSRCLSALCDVLEQLYSCKRTTDNARANKKAIHELTRSRLKYMQDVYRVTLTKELIVAVLQEEKEKFLKNRKG